MADDYSFIFVLMNNEAKYYIALITLTIWTPLPECVATADKVELTEPLLLDVDGPDPPDTVLLLCGKEK